MDNTARVSLTGSVHPLVTKSVDEGSVSASLPMSRMVMVLSRSDKQEAALKSTLASLQDKSSPNYHQWLTPEQFAAQFGVTDADVESLTTWLKGQGFKVEKVGRSKQWIEFSGTAGQVESSLGVRMHTLTYQNQKHIANVSAVSLPEALAPAVRGILSLNDFRKKGNLQNIRVANRGTDGTWKALPAKQSANGGKLQPDLTFDTGSNGDGVIYALAPGDLSNIYNTAPLVKAGTNGSGTKIAIVGRSNILMSDVEAYRQIFALPAMDPNIITNGADPGDVANDDVESTLDVEISGAMAPNVTIDFVQSASTNASDGVDLSAMYIVDNVLAPIMSTSYGACEAALGTAGNAFYNSLWEQAAAEGISSLVASGDQGGAGCDYQDNFGDVITFGLAVNGLASTPYNVAVGGTMFNENGVNGTYWNGANAAGGTSAVGYIPEKVWNESCDETQTYCPPSYVSTIAAGGGGQSSCALQDVSGNCLSGYPKPTWQVGLGVPPDGVRDIPDVSLAAAGGHDGYALCFQGSCTTDVIGGVTYLTSFTQVGGTSAATPAFAGILSLIEQKNGQFQGQINQTLYTLFAASDPTKCDTNTFTDPTTVSSCVFYDITTGSNATPQETGQHATTGYDLASGIGSVNAANLMTAWTGASKLTTTTTATATPTTFTHGQPINIAIKVAATTGTGTPTGDVSLVSDKYGAGGVATLANGVVNAPVSTLPGGTYNLTARYTGDTVYGGSVSAAIPVTVNPEDAAVTLSTFTQTATGFSLNAPVVTNTVAYGSYFGITASVAGKSNQGTPTGTVSFYDGGALLGTISLTTDGTALLNTGYGPIYQYSMPIYLSVGTHAITASYSGDNSFNPVKASTASTVIVTKAHAITFNTSTSQIYVPVGTTINVAAIPNYVWTGAPSFTPTPPTGTMQFTVQNQPIGTPQPITISAANQGEVPVPEALLSYAFNTPGQGVLGAIYAGDANYMPENTASSNGYQVYFQVYSPGLKTPSVTVVANPANPTIGQVVNYTVTVHPDKAGDKVPTGTIGLSGAAVEYYLSLYQSYPLVNGVATFSTTAYQAGNGLVFANYSGDSVYSAGTSPSINVSVARATPTVTLTTPTAYVGLNNQTTLTATVVGDPTGYVVQEAALSGSIQFFDSVNGAAAQPLGIAHPLPGASFTLGTPLPAGVNVITVQYLGDINWKPVTSASVTINVTAPDYTITSASNTVNLSAGGTASTVLTITPELGFNQAITLTCGSGLPAGVSCSFSPSVVTPTGAPITTTLTLTSTGAYSVASNASWIAGGTTFSLATIALLILPRRRRSKGWMFMVMMAISMASTSFLLGCGGSSPTVSSITLSSSSVKVAVGQPVTLTASLLASGSAPTGTVTFSDGGTSLGSQAVGAGSTASITTSTLALGTHKITANYSGDSSHEASIAAPLYQAVSGSASLSVTATAGANIHAVPLTLNMQ